jgi:hypothetical protein
MQTLLVHYQNAKLHFCFPVKAVFWISFSMGFAAAVFEDIGNRKKTIGLRV